MTDSEDQPSAYAQAYGWVARMMTIVLEMVLPGLGGQWLDSRWGTRYWVLLGFGLGFALGLTHLLRMVNKHSPQASAKNEESIDDESRP